MSARNHNTKTDVAVFEIRIGYDAANATYLIIELSVPTFNFHGNHQPPAKIRVMLPSENCE
jgi:hypothetical protein